MNDGWKQLVKQRVENHLKKLQRAETVVFWDVDGCKIPHGLSCIEVSQKIRSALDELKYKKGKEATIYAYGEKIWEGTEIIKTREKTDDKIGIVDLDYHGTALIYADQNQVELQSPAIVFNKTPAEKDGRLNMLLSGMFYWAMDHPGPANLVLMLGDLSDSIITQTQFARGINYLDDSMYNVLLVQPQNVQDDLSRSVTEQGRRIWQVISADISQSDSSKQPAVDNSSV